MMPLPAANVEWPPPRVGDLLPYMDRLSAWWTGEPDALRRAYGGTRAAGRLWDGDQTGRRTRTSQYDGGLVGALARMFWGKPPSSQGATRHQLHVPLASDLCQASADILFAEEPAVVVTKDGDPERNAGGQKRLEHLLDDHVWQVLSEGAEAAAALGGTYYRITVDSDISPEPFITAVDYDGAWPEFRWGRLVAVTFWWEVRREGNLVWRHLERHELDPNGDGVVLHGLYSGSDDSLGQVVPLADNPATEGIQVDAEGAATAMPRTPGLCVVHVPNQRPNRVWRKHPVGRDLGRSDLAGVEGLLDSLDEAYTSWMRDVRLGKGRIFVAAAALEDQGPGAGAVFDSDREVYTELNVLQRQEASGLPIQAEQFAIRVQEHKDTCEGLIRQILQTSGYSAATFGDYEGGGDMTATEVRSRERRTFLTRDRKVRNYRPAMRTLLTKLMDVDAALNPAEGVSPTRGGLALEVTFPDGVVESLLHMAQTAQTLRAAEAASTDTLVRMLHPEWSDQEVQSEVDAILEERSASQPSLEDPEQGFGGGSTPPEPSDGSEENEEQLATDQG